MLVLSLYIPLWYTYRTRFRSVGGAVRFLLLNPTPITVVLYVVYKVEVWVTIVTTVGVLAGYECGYLLNDQTDSCREPGGDRLGAIRLRTGFFCLFRVGLICVSAGVFSLLTGVEETLLFATLTSLLIGVLWVHSSAWIRKTAFLRIMTFAFLAFYKFGPICIPVIGWRAAKPLLVAIFLSYGFSRVVVYGLRKYGTLEHKLLADRSHDLLHGVCLLVFAPVLLSDPRGVFSGRWSSSDLIWILYFGAWLMIQGLKFTWSWWRQVSV
jgi:hypothetical protein